MGVIGGRHLVPKLKYEHIHMTSFSKMRVDPVAQVQFISYAEYLCIQLVNSIMKSIVTETTKLSILLPSLPGVYFNILSFLNAYSKWRAIQGMVTYHQCGCITGIFSNRF